MTTIPKGLLACRQLEALILSNNKLQTLPQGLADMASLQNLVLSGNRLENADVLGSLINNSTVQFSLSLDVRQNRIKSISSWNVSFTTKLGNLQLGENRITEIPLW
jgi:Leucine-rich repeat (LRR) protein